MEIYPKLSKPDPNTTDMIQRTTHFKRIVIALLLLFALMNIVASFHAYKFTHFAVNLTEKTNSPEKLSSFGIFKTLLLGVSNPKPANVDQPRQNYSTIVLESNKKIECWQIDFDPSAMLDSALGTVVLFHGYCGSKSSMLDKSDAFCRLGYNTVLVDFMGSGGSEDDQTTIGFYEAEQVKTVFDYLTAQGETNIYLFGTSMGAVAILKAISDYDITPKGIILECPFGSMYQTTCARFEQMHTPAFPMAALLVFWGGVENGFWAFGHNPTKYAEKVSVPTLLLYGEQDKNVSRQEIDDIFTNLKGYKVLKTYELAGHENYLIQYRDEWTKDVTAFLIYN